MAWTIIVASSDAAQLELLALGAQEIANEIKSPGGSTVILEATSIEEVERKRQRRRDGGPQLLIVTASLANVQSSPNPEAQPGLGLVKSVVQEAQPPACILVSDQIEHYAFAQAIDRCEWLYVSSGTNYVEQCRQLARKLGVISSNSGSGGKEDNRVAETAPETVPSVSSPSIASAPVPDSPACSFKRSTSSSQPEGSVTYAVLEVDLVSKAYATVTLQIHKTEGDPDKYGPKVLYLNQMDVDVLIRESQNLKAKVVNALDWAADYKALGTRVGNLLWPTYFNRLYGMAYVEAGSNVRLRFNLERSLFDGLWEAIFDDSGEPGRFLMLDNTITRRASQSSVPGIVRIPADSIGIDQRDLNVLVIRSEVQGGCAPEGPDDPLWEDYWTRFTSGLPESNKGLSALAHLDDEVEVLRALRRPRKGAREDGTAYPRVTVDVLAPPKRQDKPWSLAEALQRRLKDRSRRYDIVHFAGHALFDDKPKYGDGRGYLVFSGHPKAHAVTVGEVAAWLEDSGVQLVYLGCCRSGAAAAAVELARNNVPMTIGFSWEVDDKKAVDFARYFYDELLENDLKVCHAMSMARRRLYNKHQAGDPIWASPVLVAQPPEWIQVEGLVRPRMEARRPPPQELPRAPRPARPRPPDPAGVRPPVPLHS